MRIAYLSTDPGIAYGATKGASVHLGELAAALAGEGAEVLLIVARIAPGAPDPPPGVTVESLPGPGKGASAAERVSAEPDRQTWLEARLDRFGAAALYERLALHTAAGSAAARRLKIPHLVELNAPLLQEATRYRTLPKPEVANLLERSVLRGADLVLAVSGPLASYARARGARSVCVSPNGVDVDRFDAAALRSVRPPSAVFTGTLRPWHGIEALADAWRLMGPDAPPLTVVGDGPGRELLEEAGAHVTGALPHADVPAALAAADIGIAPYAADAPPYFSPLKLFEYLAAGLAVVAADIPGVTELVDERTAVLVPPGDPEALAAAVGVARGRPTAAQAPRAERASPRRASHLGTPRPPDTRRRRRCRGVARGGSRMTATRRATVQMDLPGEARAALIEHGYEPDGSEFLTRRPDRLTVGLRTAAGTPAIGKLYPAGGGAEAARNMRALWESSFGERRDPPGMARPIEYIDEAGVLVMEHLGGRPLVELDHQADEAFRNSVELLASLHGSGAVLTSVARTAPRIVRSLRRKQARIAELAPGYAARYRAAVDAVEDAQPGDRELVCSHGDFSPRNVLAGRERYALMDWDRLKRADPARDVAHYGAWCWLRTLHGSGSYDWSALDRFVAAYESLRPGAALRKRLDFHVAAALLRMVASRFELWREESYLIPQLIEEARRRVR